MKTNVKLSEQEWLQKCAARFMERAESPAEAANVFAMVVFDAIGRNLNADPAQEADVEMSCWED